MLINIDLSEGMFLAQYKVLRENGHSPSEAFNETVEEATQSLFPLIGAKGLVSCTLPRFPQTLTYRPFNAGWTTCTTRARRPPAVARSIGPPSLRRRTGRSLRSSTRACVTAPRRAKLSTSTGAALT